MSDYVRGILEGKVHSKSRIMKEGGIGEEIRARFEESEIGEIDRKSYQARLDAHRQYFQEAGVILEDYVDLEERELSHARLAMFQAGVDPSEVEKMYDSRLKSLRMGLIQPELSAWEEYYNTTNKYSSKFHELRYKTFVHESGKMAELIGDSAAREYLEYLKLSERIKELTSMDNQEGNGAFRGLSAAMIELNLNNASAAMGVKDTWVQAASDMNTALKDGFFDLVNANFDSLSENALNALNIIHRAVVDIVYEMMKASMQKGFQEMITKGINGFFGNTAGSTAQGIPSETYQINTSGGRARGGAVASGKIYRVNELGMPELLNVDGKQFLMMGPKGGSVTSVDQSGAQQRSGAVGQTINSKPSVEFHIHNESGKDMNVTKSSDSFDGQKMVIDMWVDAVDRNVGGFGTYVKSMQRR